MESASVPPGVPEVYVCPECGRSFGRPQALGAHRSRKHGVAGSSVAAQARQRQGTTRQLSENPEPLSEWETAAEPEVIEELPEVAAALELAEAHDNLASALGRLAAARAALRALLEG